MLQELLGAAVAGGQGYIQGTERAKEDIERDAQRARQAEMFGWQQADEEERRFARPLQRRALTRAEGREIMEDEWAQDDRKFLTGTLRPEQTAQIADAATQRARAAELRARERVYERVNVPLRAGDYQKAYDTLHETYPNDFPKANVIVREGGLIDVVSPDGSVLMQGATPTQIENAVHKIFHPSLGQDAIAGAGEGGRGASIADAVGLAREIREMRSDFNEFEEVNKGEIDRIAARLRNNSPITPAQQHLYDRYLGYIQTIHEYEDLHRSLVSVVGSGGTGGGRLAPSVFANVPPTISAPRPQSQPQPPPRSVAEIRAMYEAQEAERLEALRRAGLAASNAIGIPPFGANVPITELPQSAIRR